MSSDARQVSRGPRRDSAATMRCAVPGTRRERVAATAARRRQRRSGATARRAATSRSRASLRVHGLGVRAGEHVQVDAREPAWPAARARRNPRSCAANESAGAMPACAPQATVASERYCGASAKRARFSAACSMTSRLSRSKRPRPTSRKAVRGAAALALQAARNRRDVAGVAANDPMLQPVADDAAEPLVDVGGGAARGHAAQHRDRGGRGARIGHVADAARGR